MVFEQGEGGLYRDTGPRFLQSQTKDSLLSRLVRQARDINEDTYQWMKSVLNGCIGKEVKPV